MRRSNVALRTEDYFRKRADQANIREGKRILARAGKKQPPVPGDEVQPATPRISGFRP